MQTNEVIKKLIDLVNNDFSATGTFEAVYAFDKKNLLLPIKKTYIAVRTTENAVSFFTDETQECCQRTKVEVSVNLYSPVREKTIDTYTLAETVLDYLCIEFAGKMDGYKIGSIGVDDDLKAFKLPCKLYFVYEQCPAFTDQGAVLKPYADFYCKAHVTDEVMHLSKEERKRFEEPYVMGVYSGDGEKEQKISLDFTPSILFVYAASSSVVGKDSETDEFITYFAIATKLKSMKGLYIQSNGFRVSQGDTISANNTHPRLNILGQSYAFIAFK